MNNSGNTSGPLFLGIDVGTGSARAGLFDLRGQLLGTGKQNIKLWRDAGGIAEQSSEDIWQAVSSAVRSAIARAGADGSAIAGIGFDATCSLVAVGKNGAPITVSGSADPDRNIIVWMDQRATEQAARINATGHRVLDYVGGRISPEMETPKLLWLKENLPESYYNAAYFFDLADYLTWRATGDLSRSICTVTCKWTYLAHEKSFDASYFNDIGIGDLCNKNFEKIGSRIVSPGVPLGSGLNDQAARDFGIPAGIPVAAGLIDAHAGGVGTIGAAGAAPETRLAYVFGTSACTMSSSRRETFVPGVWGPYYSAMVPDLWLNEGGQSAAGEAIAHLIKLHPNYPSAAATAEANGVSVPDQLLSYVESKISTPQDAIRLAGDVVVVPEFLGNRAPYADPSARAILSGLDLGSDIDSHVALYVAGLAGIGYGLRQILEAQAASGLSPDTVVISGGAGASPIIKQILADAANIKTAESGSAEPVLLGSAMLGAVAAGSYGSLIEAMAAMSSLKNVHLPAGGAIKRQHDQRFRLFQALQSAARENRLHDVSMQNDRSGSA